MALCSETLILEPDLDHSKVDLVTILEAWDEVQRNAVEVASSDGNAGSVFEFSANECIYFASINRYLPQESCTEGKEKKKSPKWFAGPTGMSVSHANQPLPQPPIASLSNADIWNVQEDDLWEDDGAPSLSQATPQAAKNTRSPQAARWQTIGVIYLTSATFAGEVNLGIALAAKYRGQGLAREAVNILLKWVFDEARYHRVQVMLMEGPGRDTTLKLFTALGFAHEGTRRRQVLSPFSAEYRDVTCLAILDTEYNIRNYFHLSPNNLWDELFARHQREREDLLKWESGRSVMKRTQSMETVRIKVDDTTLSSESDQGEGASHPTRPQTSEALGYYVGFGSEIRPPAHREDVCEDIFAPSPSPSISAENPSLAEHWETDSNHSVSSGFDVASPPPPSEVSNSSGWEVDSDFGGSSSSWDKLDTSSVASTERRSISGDGEME